MKIKSEVIVGLTAVVVSICALFVSIRQSRMMKIQQEAMLYPHLIMGPGYSSDGFELSLKNSGTGIAMIKSVEVSCRGQYFNDWEEIFDFFLPPEHNVGWNTVGASTISETVLIPGEEVILFNAPWNPETRALVDSIYELDFKIQYGSLLEKHWEISSKNRTPQPIKFNSRERSVQFE